jgi:hypothetical protein
VSRHAQATVEEEQEEDEEEEEEEEEKEQWPEERKSASAGHHAASAAAVAAAAASASASAHGSDDGKSDDDDDDDDDAGAAQRSNNRHRSRATAVEDSSTELLMPVLSSAPPEDASDPFGSVEVRATALLNALSPAYLPRRLPGLEAEQALLGELLARTMADVRQNNAALLLGPAGSGKTALLNLCIATLRSEWARQGRELIVIRLSGPLQSDDTLALRSIVSQLASEHELEPLKPTADFHTALAFLHDILAQGAFASSAGSTAILFVLDEFEHFVSRPKQTLLYNLCDLLQSARAHMLLIGLTSHLDCYERMEKRIRSRMSHRRIHVRATAAEEEMMLLHSLSGEGGGDESEDLSGMEARSAALRTHAEAQQKRDLANLRRMLRDRLELGIRHEDRAKIEAAEAEAEAEAAEAEKAEAAGAKKSQTSASSSSKRKSNANSAAAVAASTAAAPSSALTPLSVTEAFCSSAAARAHNASVAALLSPTASPRLHARLASLLAQGRMPRFFLSAARLAVAASLCHSSEDGSHPHLLEQDLLWSLSHQDKEWTERSLKACSVLELTLLVALLQLSRRGVTRLNFAQAYACYAAFAARAAEGGAMSVSAVARFTRPAAAKAWENLLAASSVLVWSEAGVPHNSSLGCHQGDPLYTGRQVQRDFEPIRVRVSEQELLEALRGGGGGAGASGGTTTTGAAAGAKAGTKAPTWLVQWAMRGLAE